MNPILLKRAVWNVGVCMYYQACGFVQFCPLRRNSERMQVIATNQIGCRRAATSSESCGSQRPRAFEHVERAVANPRFRISPAFLMKFLHLDVVLSVLSSLPAGHPRH